MSASVRGTVTAGNIPACPDCGSVTARISNILRRCLNASCKRNSAQHPIEFRWHAAAGNSRLHYTTDGSDPAPETEQGRYAGRMHTKRRGYGHRVVKP